MLEKLLSNITKIPDPSKRIIHGFEHNEDAVIVSSVPQGMALVQTIDILTPIGNNPRLFGQVAAANALSDVYAVGGKAWSCMNVLAFPSKELDIEILVEILQGGIEKIIEAEAVLAGGHTLEEDVLKFGLSVTGYIDPQNIASNAGLRENDELLLTKPIGSGVLATAIKANWKGLDKTVELENNLYYWATMLNKKASTLIQEMQLKAATDITGFGLGGHLLEMAKASKVSIELDLGSIPFMPDVLDFAEHGLIPAGTYTNRKHCVPYTHHAYNLENDNLVLKALLAFDPQTSGGLVLAIPKERLDEAKQRLNILNVEHWHIGRVKKNSLTNEHLILA